MKKKDAILLALNNFPKIESELLKFGSNIEFFVDLISRNSYSLDELGRSPNTRVAFIKRLFPSKEKGHKICTYLLSTINLKYCHKCNNAKSITEFHSNSSHKDNLNTYCSKCHYEDLVTKQPSVTAKRKAVKLKATPKWANLKIIKEIYRTCPKDCHVDHIIPLQNDLVCGLHVENNLRHLPIKENLIKGNKLIMS